MSQNYDGQPASRDIDRLDTENTMRALREQMWGSQQNPGLIWAIGDLTKNVNKLTETVSSLSTDIHSDDGVRATVKDIKRELGDIKSKIADFEKAKNKGMLWLAGIGFCAVVTVLRIGYQVGSGMGLKL